VLATELSEGARISLAAGAAAVGCDSADRIRALSDTGLFAWPSAPRRNNCAFLPALVAGLLLASFDILLILDDQNNIVEILVRSRLLTTSRLASVEENWNFE
jgi:hypothetical protein